MLLAGGQGSRLYLLTEHLAKPAVPFGSKYRIIDFPLSNCINSGIDTVGVLTQYQPLALNEYIGNGQPWDLDRSMGGVMVLPPYQASKRADWYKGTANAIYQNMHFIDRYDPDYVIVLSGDHIYKMDYREMIDAHKANNADCTIAVIDVTLEEATRFGIMETDQDMRIIGFEEKPKVPKSTKASMGVYCFSKDKLFKYLIADEADPKSEKDFGKNVIPAMLAGGERMFAYSFKGYWKDVGTLTSLWEANMDLLGDRPLLDLYDPSARILSRSEARAPHYIGDSARISNSLIAGGCVINGTVINSVLSGGVVVSHDAVIKDSVILSDVTVSVGAEIDYSIIDSGVKVGVCAKVGGSKENGDEITLVGSDVSIPDRAYVSAGARVDSEYFKKTGANA